MNLLLTVCRKWMKKDLQSSWLRQREGGSEDKTKMQRYFVQSSCVEFVRQRLQTSWPSACLMFVAVEGKWRPLTLRRDPYSPVSLRHLLARCSHGFVHVPLSTWFCEFFIKHDIHINIDRKSLGKCPSVPGLPLEWPGNKNNYG